MIPSVLHRIWLGTSPKPTDYLPSFLKHHQGWRIMNWDDKALRSQGWWHWDLAPTFRAKSNIARLLVLERFGGVYVDWDVEFRKSILPLLYHKAFIGYQSDGLCCNAIIGSERNARWLQRAMLDQEQYINDASPWGSKSITSVVEQDSPVITLSSDYLYPFSWFEKHKAADHFPLAYTYHYWDSAHD